MILAFTVKLFLFSLLSILLSSCFTSKSLTKKGEPVTMETLRSMQPGKLYTVKFKDGWKLQIYVDSVGAEKLTGATKGWSNTGRLIKKPYEEKVAYFQEQAVKIYRKKFNPVLTVIVVVVPIAILTFQAPGSITIN